LVSGGEMMPPRFLRPATTVAESRPLGSGSASRAGDLPGDVAMCGSLYPLRPREEKIKYTGTKKSTRL